MKKGFTMIELIFVIVILGILAAVAIPKLAASREDARASALLGNFKSVTNTVQTQMLALRAQPDMEVLFGPAGLHGDINVVDASNISITDGTTTCITVEVNATHVIVANLDITGACSRFDAVIAENINILGIGVVR